MVMWTKSVNPENAWKGALAGMIGGIAGALVMELFQAGLQKATGQKSSEGEPATVKAANRMSVAATDEPVAEDNKNLAGEMVHYAMGAGSGMVYGLAAEVLPKSSAGYGALFGAALWMLADEVGVPAAGLAKGPDETPVAQQASALAAHLVYGVTTDAGFATSFGSGRTSGVRVDYRRGAPGRAGGVGLTYKNLL